MKCAIALAAAAVLILACAGCGAQPSTAPVANTPPPLPPASTPTPTPVPGIGDPVVIKSGGQAVSVTVVKVFKTRWVPFLGDFMASEPGAQLRGGWTWLVARLRFKNVGDSYYHSVVANWTSMRASRNSSSEVDASGGEWDDHGWMDLQGSTDEVGQMQLDSGKKKTWFVAFKVRSVARPVSLTYQGPGDKKVTISLR